MVASAMQLKGSLSRKCGCAVARRLTLLHQAVGVVQDNALPQRSSAAQFEKLQSIERCEATAMKLESHSCDVEDAKVQWHDVKEGLTHSSSSSDSSEGRATSSSSVSCFLLRVDIVFN